MQEHLKLLHEAIANISFAKGPSYLLALIPVRCRQLRRLLNAAVTCNPDAWQPLSHK